MAGSVNKAVLLGNLGRDPEIKVMPSGEKMASFSIATSESWKGKSGEKQERTQWHNVVVWNPALVGIVESYVKKDPSSISRARSRHANTPARTA